MIAVLHDFGSVEYPPMSNKCIVTWCSDRFFILKLIRYRVTEIQARELGYFSK